MFLRLQEYHRPRDLAEALRLLARPATRLIGGGTALVGPLDAETESLVDLTLLGLDTIRPVGQALAVGATTRLTTLLATPELQSIGGGLIGHVCEGTLVPTLLNRATVGGILARPERAEELIAVLLALNVQVLTVRLNRKAPGLIREGWDLGSFLRRRAEILASSLIEEIHIPTEPVVAAVESVARTPRDPAVVSVVAVLELSDHGPGRIRLAASGLSPLPERMETAESGLQGVPLTDVFIAHAGMVARRTAYPPDDYRGSADYRRHLAEVLTRRTLEAVRTAAAAGRE